MCFSQPPVVGITGEAGKKSHTEEKKRKLSRQNRRKKYSDVFDFY